MFCENLYMYECIIYFVCSNLYLLYVATYVYNKFYFLQLLFKCVKTFIFMAICIWNYVYDNLLLFYYICTTSYICDNSCIWQILFLEQKAPPVLVRTELTKFAYVCSGVIRFECPNVKFDQYSERKHKKFYSLIEFQGTPMLLFCAWSILIGQAADGSTCLQNPILALTTNGRPLQCAQFAKSNQIFPTVRFRSTLELA